MNKRYEGQAFAINLESDPDSKYYKVWVADKTTGSKAERIYDHKHKAIIHYERMIITFGSLSEYDPNLKRYN